MPRCFAPLQAARAVRFPLVREIFAMFDEDRDGVLKEKEYRNYLAALGRVYSDEQRWAARWAADCEATGCAAPGAAGDADDDAGAAAARNGGGADDGDGDDVEPADAGGGGGGGITWGAFEGRVYGEFRTGAMAQADLATCHRARPDLMLDPEPE
jgi:hypothetical protein